jgi:AcrR family transcriptional regulator
MFNFVPEMENFNEKQIQILQVAEKLFAEKGFDGTSIREISKESKVNVAMVSYYFGSKEKLLESLIVHRTSDLKNVLKDISSEILNPIQKIEKFIQLYIERINNNRNFHHILLFEISSKKRAMDFESFNEIKKANINSLEKIIIEGQSQDIFKKDINLHLIIPTILGTYFYFQMHKTFLGTVLSLETDEKYNEYIKKELTNHIQQTIKSLLLYAN